MSCKEVGVAARLRSLRLEKSAGKKHSWTRGKIKRLYFKKKQTLTFMFDSTLMLMIRKYRGYQTEVNKKYQTRAEPLKNKQIFTENFNLRSAIFMLISLHKTTFV